MDGFITQGIGCPADIPAGITALPPTMSWRFWTSPALMCPRCAPGNDILSTASLVAPAQSGKMTVAGPRRRGPHGRQNASRSLAFCRRSTELLRRSAPARHPSTRRTRQQRHPADHSDEHQIEHPESKPAMLPLHHQPRRRTCRFSRLCAVLEPHRPEGRLVQYAARILRPCDGKATTEVHDYHDELTGALASSLAKRAPGYTSLGFPDPANIPTHPLLGYDARRFRLGHWHSLPGGQ